MAREGMIRRWGWLFVWYALIASYGLLERYISIYEAAERSDFWASERSVKLMKIDPVIRELRVSEVSDAQRDEARSLSIAKTDTSGRKGMK